MDFENSVILMLMDFWVGTLGEEDQEKRRLATLKLSSPYLFYWEPPDAGYKFIFDGRPLNVQGDPLKAGQSAAVDSCLPSVPSAAVKYRFFVEDWNSFIYVACGAVEFDWND